MDSGLRWADLVVGEGREVTAGSTAVMHYSGWLENGNKFDSSYEKGSPFSVRNVGNGRVIAGSNCQTEHSVLPDIEGDGYVALRIPELSVAGGKYLLSFSIHSSDHAINYHRLDNCFPIEVSTNDKFDGVYLKTEWSLHAGGA